MKYLCFICCLVQHCLLAYSYPQISSATEKYELNHNVVYDVHCSSTGYVWLATDTGISRYDGFRFRNFPLTFSSDTSSSPSAVHSIAEGDANMLYLKLLQGGLACFDARKDTYIPVCLKAPFASEEITDISLYGKHFICIGTKRGLYTGTVDRRQEGKKETVQIDISEKPVVQGVVSRLCGDGEEIFVSVDKNKVWRYSPAVGKAEILQGCGGNKEITALYLQDYYLWICSSQGNIRCYDWKRKKLARVIDDRRNPERMALSDTEIKTMTAINDSTYYIATWNGLFQLAFDAKDMAKADYELSVMQQDSNSESSGLSGKLSDICWSQAQHLLWVAMYGNGLMKLDFECDVYRKLSQRFDTDIVGVAQDMQGYVWLSVRQRGIWRSAGKSFSANSVFKPWTEGVNVDGTYSLYKDRNGFLWLGDEASKVVCINPSSREVAGFRLLPKGMKDSPVGIRQFLVDARNRLWIVTTGGLLLSSEKTGECDIVPVDEDERVKEVYCISEDKNGSIWLGTDCGVKRMEFLNGKAELYGGYEKRAGLKKMSAFSIYVNGSNQIFVSYPDRVLRIDRHNKKDNEENVSVTVIQGIKGDVSAIVDDQNGNTWLGDNSEIATLRNDGDFLYKYPLQGGCDRVCRLRDGRLLWVNAGNLLFFDPVVIKSNKNKSFLVLSELEVNGRPVAVEESVNGHVVLEHIPALQQKFIFYSENADVTFYFSDMQYDGELRKIAYRLLPEEEWNIGPLEDGVSYKNLPVGNYVLQVKLVFPDASEGGVLELSVIIKNNWWKTGWAYAGYFLIFLAALTGGHYYWDCRAKKRVANRVRELELKEMLKLEKIKRDQNQEIEEMRDRLLALFIQELRTPLSLIIAPLKELAGEQLSSDTLAKVHAAYRNSVDMLDACNQLLAIYTEKPLEEKLEVSLCMVDNLVNDTVFSVNELIRVNRIDFRCRKLPKNMEVYVDYRRMCFILHNLLSNAFNHIHYSGIVTLSVSETVENEIRYCRISVLDSGKSVVKEARQCLFDDKENFLKDAPTIELGYELMERIVQFHHGFMSMKSEEGKGTEITLNIPIGKEILENDPNIVFVAPELREAPKDTWRQEENMLPVQEKVEMEEVSQVVNEVPSVSKRKTLLVVEDHKDIRLYLKVLFGKEYDILMAVNGQEGIEMAQREQPDLILCDVMMPVVDGFQCCKEVKEGLDTCHIPFIMLTAKVEDDDIIHGLEMGADDYILKPFTPGILKAKVRNLINGRITLKQMYTKLLVLPDGENEQREEEGEEKGDPFVNMVIKIVEENIREADFSVKKLASEMNMSQPTLYRKIKQTTDFTVIELIRGVRMRRAAIILKQKRYAVQEVAEMVGYNDIPTFRKHFVDTFGTTPSTYANTVEKGA